LGRKGVLWIETFGEISGMPLIKPKKLATSNDFHEIKMFVAQHGTNRRLGEEKCRGCGWGVLKLLMVTPKTPPPVSSTKMLIPR